MAGVRAQLARTRRLAACKVHPVLAQFGGQAGWEAFQADAEAGMSDGRYDRRDVNGVLHALRFWMVSLAE